MFRKFALVAAVAALFSGAEAHKNHTSNIKTDGKKVKSTTKSQKVKEFSICLYIPYGSGTRRLDAEEEERNLGEVNTAGVGAGYFALFDLYGYNGYAAGANLFVNYLSAIMYDCDSGTEIGTYGVSCMGDGAFGLVYGGYGNPFGEPVQSDCEHNFAFTGEPGSALVIHTSEGLYGSTVTTLGGSGKFSKSVVTSVDLFSDPESGEDGITLGYKTRGYNPLFWKDMNGPKKSHN